MRHSRAGNSLVSSAEVCCRFLNEEHRRALEDGDRGRRPPNLICMKNDISNDLNLEVINRFSTLGPGRMLLS